MSEHLRPDETIANYQDQLCDAHQRITELEAEVETWKRGRETMIAEIARIRAEVERLEGLLRDAYEFETARLCHEYGIDRDPLTPDGHTPKWYVAAAAYLKGERDG